MRLTLRNLLAYLDDILEPEDAEQIRAKLNDSKFAADLVHKIRDSMKRLRLGAPDVNDRSKGLDPNTVAEYLDNTLHTDRVTDFEKVCLDSDVHLAEVASCHQILAMVLGEPAEVDTKSRNRMYQLPALVTAQAKEAVERSEDLTNAPTVASKNRPKPKVPDYLRVQEKPHRITLPVALVGLLLAGILGIVLLATTGQFEPDAPLGKLFGFKSDQQEKVVQSEPSTRGENQTDAVQQKSTSSNTKESDTSENRADVIGTPVDDTNTIPLPTKPTQKENGLETPSKVSSIPTKVPAEIPNPSSEVGVAVVGDLPASEKEGSEHAAAAETNQGMNRNGKGSVAPTPDMLAKLPRHPEAPKAGQADLESPVAPLPPEPVGKLVSTDQILLRFDTSTDSWQRVSDSGHIVAGELLLCLPTFRPSLLIDNQIRVQLIGNTRVRLGDPDTDGVPTLIVESGRLLLGSTEDGVRLHLQTKDRSGVITLIDTDSSLAIEASRASLPNDPETHPAPLAMNLIAIHSKFLWQEKEDQTSLAVSATDRLTLNDQPLEVLPLTVLPKWIQPNSISLLDKRASSVILHLLEDERPISLLFRELGVHRQREVRWLAQRCQASIGEFRSMIEILDDPEQKASWPDYVDQLRLAVWQGPRMAARVRTVMEKLHGSEGVGLYELLWGYRKPLRTDEGIRLVDFLEHDSLAFRRLAIWNLKNTTGIGLHYFPEETKAKRTRAVSEWRERFKASERDHSVVQPADSRKNDFNDALSPDS